MHGEEARPFIIGEDSMGSCQIGEICHGHTNVWEEDLMGCQASLFFCFGLEVSVN